MNARPFNRCVYSRGLSGQRRNQQSAAQLQGAHCIVLATALLMLAIGGLAVPVAAATGSVAQCPHVRSEVTARAAGEGPAILTEPRLPRVRANGIPSLAALLTQGAAASATFRRLVATIDASDGIVYIEPGACRHGVRACLMLTVHVAGPHRILRIAVDTHRDRRELLAAIGHELQHAVEVLDDRHVTNYHTMYSFFEHIGPTGSERFETLAAVRVGMDVMADLRTTVE